jgi:hypothetical protein
MHSNFITPPDLVETVLVLNATDEQVAELAAVLKAGNKPYNVYFYNDAMNDLRWLARVSNMANLTIEADKNNPTEYFNK